MSKHARSEVLPPTEIQMEPTIAQPALVFIGMLDSPILQEIDAIGEATGFQTDVNSDVSTADLVLFTIHAPDGPMVPTVTEIEKREGQTFSRAAIFIVRVADLNDKELLQLVELQTREVLARYMDPTLASWTQVSSLCTTSCCSCRHLRSALPGGAGSNKDPR